MSNKLFVHLSLYIYMACSLVITKGVAFGILEMAYIVWLCTHYCIAWHSELCRKPMVATVPVQHHLLMQLHTLLGMKAGDMASHLIHCIDIFTAMAYGVMLPLLTATVSVQHRLLGIMMQLHTLLGMKEGVHVHLYAFLYG